MRKWLSWALLIIGLILLGQDLGFWGFWTVGNWTIAFLFVSLWYLCHECLPMTQKKKK